MTDTPRTIHDVEAEWRRRDRLIHRADLSCRARHVLRVMLVYAYEDSWQTGWTIPVPEPTCRATRATLAHDTATSVRTVQRALTELRAQGWITGGAGEWRLMVGRMRPDADEPADE